MDDEGSDRRKVRVLLHELAPESDVRSSGQVFEKLVTQLFVPIVALRAVALMNEPCYDWVTCGELV